MDAGIFVDMENNEHNIHMVSDALRETREHMGLSVADVSEKTNIRTVYIEAIEKGLIEDLPGDIYIDAYIRTYAELLGLDAEKLVEQLHKKKTRFRDKVRHTLPDIKQEPYSPPAWVLLLAVMLLFAAFIAMKQLVLRPDFVQAQSPSATEAYAEMLREPEHRVTLTALEPLDVIVENTSGLQQEYNLDAGTHIELPVQEHYLLYPSEKAHMQLSVSGYKVQDLRGLEHGEQGIFFSAYDLIGRTEIGTQ